MGYENQLSRRKISITLGDPAGIGSEVILKALADPEVKNAADYLILGNRSILEETAATIGLDDLPATVTDASEPSDGCSLLEVGDIPAGGILRNQVSAEAGRLSIGYLMKAIELAKADQVDAIVTAPINKEAIYKAGFDFPGHTEVLAKETNTEKFVMMLVGGPLRVALVTIHVPLRAIFDLITKEAIIDTVTVTNDSLKKYFGLPFPRIGVCGLNPHASDGGRFGDEEARIVSPAIQELQSMGINCTGPLPPDTAFYQAGQGDYDVMVALYHDQGLIPLKLVGFETGVNVTLGLPIIRTSVDHGTAFDIVGENKASPASMIEAIRLAISMAETKVV